VRHVAVRPNNCRTLVVIAADSDHPGNVLMHCYMAVMLVCRHRVKSSLTTVRLSRQQTFLLLLEVCNVMKCISISELLQFACMFSDSIAVKFIVKALLFAFLSHILQMLVKTLSDIGEKLLATYCGHLA